MDPRNSKELVDKAKERSEQLLHNMMFIYLDFFSFCFYMSNLRNFVVFSFKCFSFAGIGALLMCMLAVLNMPFFIYFTPGSGTRFVNMLFFYFSRVQGLLSP